MGEISITKLLVVAALIILVFGTKKLRTLGGDRGRLSRALKKAMNEDDDSAKKTTAEEEAPAQKLSHKE
ncbi:twin-arginine translocase subunit TatE [Klebsiella pneumoniae]|uniref:Sec-independent protein translocase protein TatA n=1 Tax=Klebsiella pneumoniae TaxID=573 RepID=A0A927E2V3_KLEPN|nr:twin-arginine translocase subunit TatE [Klebsiella pneumoniae]